MNNLVIMQDNQAVTTSLQVAEVFGKEHKNVIRDIENIMAQNGAVKNLFDETTYHSRGRKFKKYFISRDGFSLLVMGFTGKEALEFKLDFIKAFNQMEKNLKESAPTNMVEALTLALEQAKTIEIQNQVIGELKPKADYVDQILKSKSSMTITQIAKDYGMSGTSLNKLLFSLGVQYKQSRQWLLYAKYHSKGYTKSVTSDLLKSKGIDKVVINTEWTQKGRMFLYELLKKEGILPLLEQDGKNREVSQC